MRIEVIRAWPRRFDACMLQLPKGATAAQAVNAAGWAGDPEIVALAVHGERVDGDRALVDRDRVELLRVLACDPKESRRRRARQAPAA